MAPTIPHRALDQFPPELIRYAAEEAERDATDMAAFLAEAGVVPEPGRPIGVAPGILLDLGAVARLRRWEAAGITVHREAGLPTARAALHRVIGMLLARFVDLATPGTDGNFVRDVSRLVERLRASGGDQAATAVAGDLHRAVARLTLTRFAWAARPELGADVVLDVRDDDALVETLAQFLWTHRASAPAAG
jgi:hypothetical protein